MKITCLCPTHGRPYLLAEAVESFRRQTPSRFCDHELLIVNDCPEQRLTCSVPGVRVVNLDRMVRDLSEKFNIAVEMADGEAVAWWEDDDISLPDRLAETATILEDMCIDAYKENRAWFWERGDIVSRPVNLFFGSSIFRKSAWAGAAIGKAADKTAWERMTNVCTAIEEYPTPHQTHFIYRWAGTGHHDSGVRGTNDDRFRAFRRAVLNDPRFVAGEIEVVPRWHHDYEAQAKAAIRDGRGNKVG